MHDAGVVVSGVVGPMQQTTRRPIEDAQEERETAKPVKPIPLLHGGDLPSCRNRETRTRYDAADDLSILSDEPALHLAKCMSILPRDARLSLSVSPEPIVDNGRATSLCSQP
jgi:hypothetical protein